MTNPIPTNWKQVKLGDCIEKMQGGGTPSKQISDYWNGNIPWATVKDITKFHPNSTQDYISKNGLENSSSKLIKKGTLIMPTRMALGIAVFFDIDVSINQDLKAINFNETFNKVFAFYWIQKNSLRIKRLGTGSTVDGISQDELKAIKLSLPPLPEQHRITIILETWDKIIEKLIQKIELKKNIKKGLIQGLLTGNRRLSEFNDDWQTVKLGDICDISRGGSPRPIQDYITNDDEGLNWLKIGDIKKGARFITKTKCKIKKEGLNRTTEVNPGDFILSNSMSFGRPYIMKIKACIHDGWLAFKKIKPAFNSTFLYYKLTTQEVQNEFSSISAGSGVQNLKKESVSEVSIRFPNKEEQTAIAKILTTADNEITALEKKKKILEDQKKFLLNNLITGQIRTPEKLTMPQ